jgi:Kef-type K+ transport system membrane component KefB/mannitol/fructose-specific phosphotransferase system IIA component (Ntr-type)
MAQLTIHDTMTIFLALAILLGVARALGEVARHFRQPAVLGEILAGILLGPTVFGRIAPVLQSSIFPTEGNVSIVLKGVSALAVVLFLLVAGMEVDLAAAFRQGRSTLRIALWGLAVPFAMGWVMADYFPELFMKNSGAIFPIFLATALSISALPVVAKILKDLNLIKTDLGTIVVSAATINDLCGWMLFAVVLGMAGNTSGGILAGSFPIWAVIGMTLSFVLVMLTLGRWLIHKLLPFIQAHTSWPAGMLGFALTGALLCAALTEFIGIHAIFGAFIFGVAFGDSPHLRERTRETLDQFISCIFAPFFFASIGLNLDFVANFSFVPVVTILVIAIVGKLAGCYAAGVFSGLSKRESLAIGFAENARGAMEIILGLLALRAGIIDEKLFVALVIMALLTSMTAGWMMEKVLNRPIPLNFIDLLSARSYVSSMSAATNEAAVSELSSLAAAVSGQDETEIRTKVWEREKMIPTGLPGRVAIPHARLDHLEHPVIILGRSVNGVDFDAPDGHAARLVFLILTPTEDPGFQLEIIAGIAREFSKPGRAEQLARCENFTELLASLKVQE